MKCELRSANYENQMEKLELKERTKSFALAIIRLTSSLPFKREIDIISRQLLRSATSIGANYRAACRSRSKAEFISKIGIVEEETDETAYWLELLLGSRLVENEILQPLLKEVNELMAIFVAIKKTAKSQTANG